MTTPQTSLREAREALVREHFESESTQDFDVPSPPSTTPATK